MDEPAEQVLAEGVEDVGDVGVVVRGLMFGQGLVSLTGEGLGEISDKDLGVEILTDGFGEFAAELLDIKSMLEEFESLFDVPAGVVEAAELGRRERVRIGQRGRQDLDAAIRQDDLDEPQDEGRITQFQADGPGFAAQLGGDRPGEEGFGWVGARW